MPNRIGKTWLLIAGVIAMPALASQDLNTALGGAAAGVAGTIIGQQMGGQTGALAGAAIGGAVGSAATTKHGRRNEAALGGAIGALSGAALGQQVGGENGQLLGAGIGGAAGAVLGAKTGDSGKSAGKRHYYPERDEHHAPHKPWKPSWQKPHHHENDYYRPHPGPGHHRGHRR